MTLRYLADHYFLIKKYDLCKEFAEVGLFILQSKQKPERAELSNFRQEIEVLRSHFYFILGKVEHVQGNDQEAFQQYERSLSHNSKNHQTHFCLAKVNYQMGNFQAAEKHLNQVLSCHSFKDCYEAIRMLAQIKARQSNAQRQPNETLRLFRRVLELNPKDFDANFEIAALFEQTEPLQALIYYEAGINIMREEIGCDK